MRISHVSNVLATMLLVVASAISANGAEGPSSCAAKINSLKSAEPLSTLAKSQQKKVLRALNDDIAEIAEIDIASTERSKAGYKQYVADRLQFERVKTASPNKQLLMVSYKSHTMCGQHENCPVWIVSLDAAKARSMVPWQEELGTSAGGGWGFVSRPGSNASFPELILLTHLSSAQTGLACYRESRQQYLRVPCSPECSRWLQYADEW
jgi:hypothetical protein